VKQLTEHVKQLRAWATGIRCPVVSRRARFGLRTASTLTALIGWVALLSLAASPASAPLNQQPPPVLDADSPGIVLAQAPFDLADPFLLDTGHSYDLFVSTGLGDTTQNVPVLEGQAGQWSEAANAVPALPTWADPTGTTPTWSNPSDGEVPGESWTPAVYRLGGRYVIYVAPTLREAPHHCLAVGASTSPTGPFLFAPQPLVCQFNQGGDIDPQLFVDPQGPDGPAHPDYLVWKSDNNSLPGTGAPTIWIAPLSNDGLSLDGSPVAIFQPDEAWQDGLVEAPQMALAPDGSVWLFYSGGTGFFSSDYAIGVARCAGVLGPCHDVSPKPLLGSNSQGSGPGEETYFTANNGSDWLLYSPMHFGGLAGLDRPIEAARIGWSALGPYLAQAGTFPAP
jgi:hypothetical protein